MQTSDLIYIGIKGSVIALERHSGKQVWATHLRGAGFVNVVVHGNAILASSYGEIFCLDPATGAGRWSNPLTGFGYGLATIAFAGQLTGPINAVLAEQIQEDEANTSAATMSSAAAITASA